MQSALESLDLIKQETNADHVPFCTDWTDVSVCRCSNLAATNFKRLATVIEVKCSSTYYWTMGAEYKLNTCHILICHSLITETCDGLSSIIPKQYTEVCGWNQTKWKHWACWYRSKNMFSHRKCNIQRWVELTFLNETMPLTNTRET